MPRPRRRNAWACDVNETLMRQTIDAFVTLGLKDAGFEYVSMDGECLRLCSWGGGLLLLPRAAAPLPLPLRHSRVVLSPNSDLLVP